MSENKAKTIKTTILGELYLVHYEGRNEEPKDNWRVYTADGDVMVGYLHDCDGIGGYVGDDAFIDSKDFNILCDFAKQDLESRRCS